MNREILIEKEKLKEEKSADITKPFSTKDIKITNAVISLSSLIARLEYGEIDLSPDFQRNSDLWRSTNMSRLIESILLKLPLPIFYFDVSNPDKWIVVDGLQRLSSIQKFVVDKKLKLKNLEFLRELEGKSYDELDRGFKRVIDETTINTYQIEAQTPKEVRYSIFNRINTGGLVLNAQEIRQALNQQGKGVAFLKECAEDEVFGRIVDVPNKRMLDRELVLRFVAFKLFENTYQNFSYNTMGEFLDRAMEKLDSIEESEKLESLKRELLQTLEFSEDILGEKHRFSRSIANKEAQNKLNHSLFDVTMVCFSEIEDKEHFRHKRELFKEKFIESLQEDNSAFVKAITEGTSGKGAIETRFKQMKRLINEVLYEN